MDHGPRCITHDPYTMTHDPSYMTHDTMYVSGINPLHPRPPVFSFDVNRFLRWLCSQRIHARPFRKLLCFGPHHRFRRKETCDRRWASVNHVMLPFFRAVAYVRFRHCIEVGKAPSVFTSNVVLVVVLVFDLLIALLLLLLL